MKELRFMMRCQPDVVGLEGEEEAAVGVAVRMTEMIPSFDCEKGKAYYEVNKEGDKIFCTTVGLGTSYEELFRDMGRALDEYVKEAQ